MAKSGCGNKWELFGGALTDWIRRLPPNAEVTTKTSKVYKLYRKASNGKASGGSKGTEWEFTVLVTKKRQEFNLAVDGKSRTVPVQLSKSLICSRPKNSPRGRKNCCVRKNAVVDQKEVQKVVSNAAQADPKITRALMQL